MMRRSEAGSWIDIHVTRPQSPFRPAPRLRFTFIELSVVVVIISIAAALIGPRLAGMVGGRSMESAVRRLAAMGEYTASLAASSGEIHVLRFELGDGSVYIAAESDITRNGPSSSRGESYRLPEGLSFEEARLEDAVKTNVLQVRFAPDGWADNASVCIRDEKGRRINIAFTLSMGKLKISERSL